MPVAQRRASVWYHDAAHMDSTSLIMGVLFGAIGLAYITYGRKQQRYAALLAGVLLCVFTYVVDGIVMPILIGVALMCLPIWLKW